MPDASAQESSILSPEIILEPTVSALLSSLYGNEIADVESDYGLDFRAAKLRSIYQHALEPGLNREVSFKTPSGTLENTGKVPMLRRSAFIDHIVRELPNYDNQINFLMLDIANLRAADLAGAANWMLNCFAFKLQEEVNKINKEFSDNGSNIRIVTCRYGGDEFAVGVLGQTDDATLTMINQRITKSVTDLPGYYKKGFEESDPIEAKKIELKNGQPERISPPEEPLDRDIFFAYLQRGLILSQSEIKKIKKDRTNEEIKEVLAQSSERKIYPKNIEGLEDKIKYITEYHKEFKEAFDLARQLDLQEQGFNKGTAVNSRKEAVLSFVENVLYDPFLDDVIVTFVDFQNHLQSGAFDGCYVFDLKLIKEINDNQSYAAGDQAIKELFDQIIGPLRAERKNVIIYRRGGTFIVAVKKGIQLSEEADKGIRKISSPERPVGFYSKHLFFKPEIGQSEKQWSEEQITELMKEAERDWYLNIFCQLIKQEGLVDKIGSDKSLGSQLAGLLHDFFRGKRKQERCRKAMDFLKSPTKTYLTKAQIDTLEPFFEKLLTLPNN